MARCNKSIHPLLLLIIFSYLAVGALYAWHTPKWQTPDEPAHFNYVQCLAEERRLPVLQPGDYPYQYLEEIKANKFPPDMSIAPLRYEFHQPPLYYALAALLYRLTAGLPFATQFFALRLLSVAFGAGILLATYCLVQAIFPHSQFLPLAATAFVAVIPMHVAMTAAINNDALAELLALLIFYLSIRTLQRGPTLPHALLTGALFGLVLLTKTTVYLLALGAIVTSALWHVKPLPGSPRFLSKGRYLLYAFALALLIAAPWFVRNAVVYGNWDILGWQRHDSIVAGQLRTADLLAEIGPLAFAQRFIRTTFNSFWAQFGWMGVPVDSRIYHALALCTALLGIGFILFLIKARRSQSGLTPVQIRALWLMAIVTWLSVLTYLAYNLKFVQHQGRYLFTALSALSLGTALSLQELLHPPTAQKLALSLLLVSLLVGIQGLLSGDWHKWTLAMLAPATAFFMAAGWLPAPLRRFLPFLLYLAFLILDLLCLFRYIIPALSIT
ncbi:MAG: glycosyltransferase family 39 protein [Chloroflexi bacterium]|nr:glycosyltransferase family 39 protein [Chloroflexota bacterium]